MDTYFCEVLRGFYVHRRDRNHGFTSTEHSHGTFFALWSVPEQCTGTKKTHEAAGFFLGLPVALLVIIGSSAEPKWVKIRKTRGFLGYCIAPSQPPSILPTPVPTPAPEGSQPLHSSFHGFKGRMNS